MTKKEKEEWRKEGKREKKEGMGNVGERGKAVICCATEPHSRRGGNSRNSGEKLRIHQPSNNELSITEALKICNFSINLVEVNRIHLPFHFGQRNYGGPDGQITQTLSAKTYERSQQI